MKQQKKSLKTFKLWNKLKDFAIDLPNSDFRARLNIAKSMGGN